MSATSIQTSSAPSGVTHSASETLEIELDAELAQLLDAFVAARNDLSRAEAVTIALREWASDRNLLPASRPDTVPLSKLNARNDV